MVEHAADLAGIVPRHPHDRPRRAAPQGPQLVGHAGLGAAAVLEVEEHPVESAQGRELCRRG